MNKKKVRILNIFLDKLIEINSEKRASKLKDTLNLDIFREEEKQKFFLIENVYSESDEDQNIKYI